MPLIKQRDLRAFSAGLEVLYAEAESASLSRRILDCLRAVFACEFASFSLLDRRRGRLQTSALAPVVPDWPGMAAHQRYLRDDPAAMHIFRTGDVGALKMSDFVSLRQYRDLSVYKEVFGRVGCNRRLGFAIQSNAPVSLVTTLNRRGRDFSEEERELLNSLRPHLLRANEQTARREREKEEEHRSREQIGALLGVGLGEVDREGRVRWLTPQAQALLSEFFPPPKAQTSSKRLPEPLKRKCEEVMRRSEGAVAGAAPNARSIWYFGDPGKRRLKFTLSGTGPADRRQLLIEDASPTVSAQRLTRLLGLTPRESEVLYWLMKGKTNWELGSILSITAKTAGRHLEHIFAKLNVDNRTAAVRVAFEAAGGGF